MLLQLGVTRFSDESFFLCFLYRSSLLNNFALFDNWWHGGGAFSCCGKHVGLSWCTEYSKLQQLAELLKCHEMPKHAEKHKIRQQNALTLTEVVMACKWMDMSRFGGSSWTSRFRWWCRYLFYVLSQDKICQHKSWNPIWNQRSCIHICSKNFALNLLLGSGRNRLFEKDKKCEQSDSVKVCFSDFLALGIELMWVFKIRSWTFSLSRAAERDGFLRGVIHLRNLRH